VLLRPNSPEPSGAVTAQTGARRPDRAVGPLGGIAAANHWSILANRIGPVSQHTVSMALSIGARVIGAGGGRVYRPMPSSGAFQVLQVARVIRAGEARQGRFSFQFRNFLIQNLISKTYPLTAAVGTLVRILGSARPAGRSGHWSRGGPPRRMQLSTKALPTQQ
jgi:hypothetical protein